jgi:flavin-dependent dehydrogenase
METRYDVIIVGGRPAGSTLAARLGQAGVRVLMLERSLFPSLPGASCPIINGATMHMLDEIGADEAQYARGTPKIREMINIVDDDAYSIQLPMTHGRDYAYAIDRARFDAALFDHAGSFSTVDAFDGWSVVDVRFDGDHVVGVVAHDRERVRHEFDADIVVGADGRFSTVARKVNAAEVDEHDDRPTTLYYAYWKNVAPFRDGAPVAAAVGSGGGYGFLMMDSADGTVALAVEGRSDLIDPQAGQAQQFYLDLLRETPVIWKRVQHAERITDVRGMKKIGNLYRAPGGDGWALTGDAYHQKDPLDGQGIYDAMFTARALAAEIVAWKRGEKSWSQALIDYDAVARAETYAMYMSTLERVRTNLYSQLPRWAMELSKRTMMRWMFDSPTIQDRLGKMMTRQIAPEDAISAPIMLGAMLTGPLRELSRALEKRIGA